MSHFYGSVQGSRGEATRQGTKDSGIDSHVGGWDIGAKVRCWVDDDGRDRVDVTITAGSPGRYTTNRLGSFYRDEAGAVKSV